MAIHITDERHPGYHLFRRTAEAHGLHLQINVSSIWRSFIDCLVTAREAAASVDAELFMYLDAYDTIVLADEDEILEKFERLNVPFLISTEKACWPDRNRADTYLPGHSEWQYVNGGGYIGQRAYVSKVLDGFSLGKGDGSNQRLFTDAYLRGQIERDDTCEIFQSCAFTEEMDDDFIISNGRLFNRATGTYPCVLHFNGRTPATEYIKRLGL